MEWHQSLESKCARSTLRTHAAQFAIHECTVVSCCTETILSVAATTTASGCSRAGPGVQLDVYRLWLSDPQQLNSLRELVVVFTACSILPTIKWRAP